MFSNTTTATNLKKKKRKEMRGKPCHTRLIRLQPLPPFPPSLLHFTALSHPYPQSSSQKFDDRKGNQRGKKKVSQSQTWREISISFVRGEPTVPRDVTWTLGQSARGRRRLRRREGRGESDRTLLPGAQGLVGGGKGLSHISLCS